MAVGLNKTKRRIASVTSTKKITKAMQMVATVKLKRFKDGFEHGSYYENEFREILGEAFLRDAKVSHYSQENEGVEGVLYLLITSNLGLCAGYNNNLYAYLDTIIDKEKDTLAIVGTKGISHYKREGKVAHVLDDFAGLDLSMEPRLINAATSKIRDDFNAKKYRKVVVVYTKYVNSLRFEPEQRTLLPVHVEFTPPKEEEYCPPLFEPSPHEMIHALLGQYLGGELYSLLQESQLSEQASRRNAMESATDNADELLGKLTIEYNKARQGQITQELTEIVNGSNNG